MRKVTEDADGGVRVGQETVSVMDFADDVALLADSWMVLVGMVMRMELVTQKFGINISARKSEMLYVGRGQGNVRVEDLQLRGQTMKQVEEFTYLGSVVASDGRIIQDVVKKGWSEKIIWLAETGIVEKDRDKSEGQNEDLQCCSVAGAAVWCDSVGNDTDGGKQAGCIGDGDAEEYCRCRMG